MQACRSLLRRSIKLVLHLLHPAPDTRLGGPKKPLGEGVHLESSSEEEQDTREPSPKARASLKPGGTRHPGDRQGQVGL